MATKKNNEKDAKAPEKTRSAAKTAGKGAKAAKSGIAAARKTSKRKAGETVKKQAGGRKAGKKAAESGDNALAGAAARLTAMEGEAKSAAAQAKTGRSAAKKRSIGQSETAAKLIAENTETVKESETGSVGSVGAAEIIYSLKAGTQIFVKTADIVAATGKTTSWVRDLTARGIITETQTKYGALFDFVQTMRAYCAVLEARRDDDTADVELKRKKAEAKLKESKAAIAEMQAKEFQGKMHRSEDVQKMTADLLYFVRGGLMALAGRCATDCAASSEPAQVQKIIEREVREILKELSEYKYDPKKYDELVRQRTNREIEAAEFDESEEE